MKVFNKFCKTIALSFVFVLTFYLVGCTDHSESKVLEKPTNFRVVVTNKKATIFITEVEHADSYYVRLYDEHNENQLKKYYISKQEAYVGYPLFLENGNYNVTVSANDSTSTYLESLQSDPYLFTIGNEVIGGDPIEDKYTITYHLNGGTLSNPVTSYKKGDTVVLPKPTKTNSNFLGWYVDSSFTGEKVEVILNTETGNKTFYAKWEQKNIEGLALTGYYKNASDKTGEELKLALRTIISTGVKRTTYDDLKSYLPYTDQDPDNSNNIILIYSKASVSKKWDPNNSWNREHVWPQSLGWFTTSGAGADVHHIRPENNRINSTRGNTPFGMISNGKDLVYEGMSCGRYNSSWFEPIPEVRGDIARIILYLFTRYSEADNYSVTRIAQSIEMLIEWHLSDPVDEFERTRNERSYSYQNNRNPFIDHPEFVEMIWG